MMDPLTPSWTPAAMAPPLHPVVQQQQQQQQRAPVVLDPEKYRTELCRTFSRFGRCRYGDACQFAHGAADLRPKRLHPRYKTTKCRTFWSKGECPYGNRCMFLHDERGDGGGDKPAAAAALPPQAPAPPVVASEWTSAAVPGAAAKPEAPQVATPDWAPSPLDMSVLMAALPPESSASSEDALLSRHELSVLELLDDSSDAASSRSSLSDDSD